MRKNKLLTVGLGIWLTLLTLLPAQERPATNGTDRITVIAIEDVPDSPSETLKELPQSKLQPRTFDTIRTNSIEITDSEGRVRVGISALGGVPYVAMYTLSGIAALEMRLVSDKPSIELADNSGKTVVTIQASDNSGGIEIRTSGDPTDLVTIGSNHNGDPLVCVGRSNDTVCRTAIGGNKKRSGTLTLANSLGEVYNFDNIQGQLSELAAKVESLALLVQSSPTSGAISAILPRYPGTKLEHSIEAKTGLGEIITLDDGSIWEVHPIDRAETGLWMPFDDVIIFESMNPVGPFRHEMLNTDDNENAKVRFLGMR